MLNKTKLALLGGASLLIALPHQAMAIDAAQVSEPTVFYANQPAPPPRTRAAYAQPQHSNLGGGFIEFLFGDGPSAQAYQQQVYQQQPAYYGNRQALPPMDPQQQMIYQEQESQGDPRLRPFDPKYEKQLVDYQGKERAGTIIIDTPNKFLYLVQGDGKALRYGVGVGKPGFAWSGVKTVSAKREWPDWTPPAEMLARRPDLPRHMEGGPENPLGARAMYLGSSLYRIHGSNEPWTIGTNVSSGCIRMRNEDVIDLYGRVNVGAKVVVM
ncbi:hypothetical protein AS156_32760 [Bradyrhizobium macuxiense]|uniref:L,D-TPase catalytic domain-containing protein n=1 Tax=Bradyrhizobium macuxiense TaxID=1755647 RepID=A0A109K1X7_9BRAD|nr:L,D-transpeptidase [Bradyrhizobium macuxiense]KWV58964.1 hypothetical protein AS156_32760 [Bradyrhizobium macuxiense]